MKPTVYTITSQILNYAYEHGDHAYGLMTFTALPNKDRCILEDCCIKPLSTEEISTPEANIAVHALTMTGLITEVVYEQREGFLAATKVGLWVFKCHEEKETVY